MDIKEIDEIAKAICSHCLEMTEEKVCPYANTEDEAGNEACFTERLHEAEKVYNAGYRKLPEDSVVLSREEFDKLGLVVEIVQEYESDEKGQPILVKERKIVKKLRTDFTELLNQEIRELQLAQERKETAEKIYTFVNSFGTHNWKRFNEFIKQFGVEIKE